MTDPRTLHSISAPPKGRAPSDLIWDHTDQSIFFRDLVQYLGVMITPALRAEIEERLPGVNIGDIEAGHVLLVRNRELSDGFEFGYYVRDDETMRHHKVTLIDSDAVESLTEAFAILVDWQEKRGGAS
jgi:hypothetical protein